MVVLAPSTSLTLPSGRAKPLVRGEGDGNPAAWSPLQGSLQWSSDLLFLTWLGAVRAGCPAFHGARAKLSMIITEAGRWMCLHGADLGSAWRLAMWALLSLPDLVQEFRQCGVIHWILCRFGG